MGSVQYELVTLVAHDLSFTQASLLQSQQLSPHNPTLSVRGMACLFRSAGLTQNGQRSPCAQVRLPISPAPP